MRVSDIFCISFIIAIFIIPLEKYNIIYKVSNKIICLKTFPIQFLPIIIKILLSFILFLLYLFLDFINLPSFIFSFSSNTIFYPLISVLSHVSGEVLIAIVGLIFTALTLFYTSTTSLRKNDVEVIFKLVDLLENNIKTVEKKIVDCEFKSIKKELGDTDLKRIFLLKKTISENKVELKKSISKSKFTNLDNENNLVLDKMNSFIDITDTSVGNLEQLMSLLIRKEVLTFKSYEYKRPLIKSYLSNKEFQFIESETNFFQIIKENYNYLVVFKKDWIDLYFIRYIFNKNAESDQSFNNIFRLIHRAIKITNNSSLHYLEKKNMIGIIRALIPDYLLIYMFYNCTYTTRGRGLAMQLVGTSFFGTENDFRDDNNFSQHFRSSTLLFKDLDSEIMKYIFNDIKIKPGNFSSELFDLRIFETIDKLDK